MPLNILSTIGGLLGSLVGVNDENDNSFVSGTLSSFSGEDSGVFLMIVLLFLDVSDPPYFRSDLLESAFRLLKNFLGLTVVITGSGATILGGGIVS